MGVLLTEGCDLYGTDEAKAEAYGWWRGEASQRCEPAAGRFGGGALHRSGGGSQWRYTLPPTGITTCWVHHSLIYPDLVQISSSFGIVRLANNTGYNCGWVKINSSLQIEIYDANGTLRATSTETFATDLWHAIQVKFVVHQTTGSIEVWANGVQAAIATSIDTLPSSGNGSVERVTFGSVLNGGDHYFDDIAVWDDSGSDWNDWTDGKDLRIDTVRPTADTAQEDFTPKSAGDQFAEVDDDPDHDGDTSYNESATPGDKDRVEASTIFGTPVAIYNVRVRGSAKKTDAGAANAKVGVYSGAAEGMSAAQGLSTAYGSLYHDLPLNPDDSLPWEKADIDAVQLQYEHA